MTQSTRIVDFQIFVGPGSLQDAVRRGCNEALFAVYEPLRLWLRAQRVQAPFAKLLVTIVDAQSMATYGGNVSIAAGVCEVLQACAFDTLPDRSRDCRWVLELVSNSLASIERQCGWHSSALLAEVRRLADQSWPLMHFFPELARTDRRSGITFTPWLSTAPGSSQVGVRLSNGRSTDLVLVSKSAPLFLEDEFPLKRTSFRGGRFVLVGPQGEELAAVDVPKSGQPAE